MRAVLPSLLLLLSAMNATAELALNGCAGSTPVATFKLYAKPNGYAPYPLREVNELTTGMKVLYQPVAIPGDDPDDARVTLILSESRSGATTPRLLVLAPKRAGKVAEWEIPFRTELVAMVFGPQGFSEGKVTELLKKDATLMEQLAGYAEQNQRVEELINVLAEAERQPRPAESLDAALSGFASRYGTPVSQIDRAAPTSEQAMALMRTLNPALTSYDPLAPDPSQRLQQSAGLAASVAGLFWGSNVALYAGGAGLFLNLRSLLFPGSDFRSALMQTGDGDRMTLCAKETERRSRTRVAYLWAARIPDRNAPGITLREEAHLGAGLASAVPVALSDASLWRHLARARDWKLIAADGRHEYPVEIVPDPAAGALRFTPPADALHGAYTLAARWDWEPLRTNGQVRIHRIPEGATVRVAVASRSHLVENATNVEISLEGADFRFVEQASLLRQDDPYATAHAVPFRRNRLDGGTAASVSVLLNAEPLQRGNYLLALRQSGGKELQAEFPVLPKPPALTALPLRLNTGAGKQRVVLQGSGLELIEGIESDSVAWERVEGAGGEVTFLGRVKPGSHAGSLEDLRLTLTDRPGITTVPQAVEIRGPLPAIATKRIAFQAERGVATREGELASGALVTVVFETVDGEMGQVLQLGCTSAAKQKAPLRISAGHREDSARLQASDPANLYLTFDPGRIGHHGCTLNARVETATGVSAPVELGRVVQLPRLAALSLTDEPVGEGSFAGTLTGEDLEAVSQVGWSAKDGMAVADVPRPLDGDLRKQRLRIALPWPAPSPRAPLYIWLRGEGEGRLTTTRLGS